MQTWQLHLLDRQRLRRTRVTGTLVDIAKAQDAEVGLRFLTWSRARLTCFLRRWEMAQPAWFCWRESF